MIKLIKKIGFLFFPLSIIIISVNYNVDPANIFIGDVYVEKIAKILASGSNVDNISNYDERKLQLYFLHSQKSKAPEVIVMGSSRIMEISNNVIPNVKILNIGVSHANINDLVALTGLIDNLQYKPKKIIINVDPFLLSKGTDEWQSLQEYYFTFNEKYCFNKKVDLENKNGGNKYQKYYSLIDFEYFKNSISYLWKGNDKEVLSVGNFKPKKYGRFFDGSIAYSEAYKNPDTLLCSKSAYKTGRTTFLPNIENNKLEQFNCLIEYFISNKVEITLLMLPYHHKFYEAINENHQNAFAKYEKLYKDLAKEKGINIIGNYNALKEGLNYSDFYDTYHCSGDAIKRIFENYIRK